MKYKSIQQIPTEKLEEEVYSLCLMYWTYATPNFEIENWYFKSEGYKKGLSLDFWEKIEKENKEILSDLKSEDSIIRGRAYSKLQRSVVANYYDLNNELVEDFFLNKKDLYAIYEKKNYPTRPKTTLNQTINAISDISLLMFNEINMRYGKLDNVALEEFKKDQKFLGVSYEDEEFAKSEFQYKQNKQSFILATTVKKEFNQISEEFLFKKYSVETSLGEICKVKYRNGVYFIGSKDIKDCSFSIVEKKEQDGTPKYYITFRGTDTNIKSFGKYALEDYKNMGSHYEKLASVFRVILKNIEKENPKFKVKVIGHSLGASMVERFMKEYPDTENIKYEGLALASPGQEHWAQNLVDYADKKREQIHDVLMEKLEPVLSFIENHSDNRITRFVSFLVEEINSIKQEIMWYAREKTFSTKTITETNLKNGINILGKSLEGFNNTFCNVVKPSNIITTFAYMGIMGQIFAGKLIVEFAQNFKSFLNIGNNQKFFFSEDEDLRIIKINNDKDIVPKVGSLVNRQHNQSIIIKNIPEKNLFIIPILNIPIKLETDYHDKSLYFIPFVKEYAKRKDANNFVLKDTIDIVMGLNGEAHNSSNYKNTINLTIEKVNENISKFKEKMSQTNPNLYVNELRI